MRIMKIYRIPEGYDNISDDFEVWAEGRKVGVYSCRVSAYPFNQVWPGYQRPLEQTEKSSFAMVGSDGDIVLQIKPKKHFNNVTIRPIAKKAEKAITNGILEVKLPGPGQYSLEFDGKHNVLTVFVNPEIEFDIDADNVIYFGPGIHFIEKKIRPHDNQTILIDAGAIVYGGIFAQNKENIKILGYGILDCSHMERQSGIESVSAEEMSKSDTGGNPIFFDNCKNIEINGITIVDAAEWSIRFDGCENVIVDNIKLIGMWRYNADGCDFCNCTNARIRNSYLRNFDDCIVVKGLKFNRNLAVENIVAENCVIWCDWGRAIEVGAETCAPYMRNICFKDSYIIHCDGVMMDISHVDRAKISDVVFENISIEYTGEENLPVIQTKCNEIYQKSEEKYVPPLFLITAMTSMWSTDDYVGDIENVRVSDININAVDKIEPLAQIQKVAPKAKIADIDIRNVMINGNEYQILKEIP